VVEVFEAVVRQMMNLRKGGDILTVTSKKSHWKNQRCCTLS